jgi:RloB-like protein
MSLVQRKARPLIRDTESLRDDRLFIVACDDTYAPRQYFEFFRIQRVQIHVVPTLDGTSVAEHVLSRLLSFDHEPDDELWMVVDVDHCAQGHHIRGFLEAITRARKASVNIALSKPCFEVWLLLHHVDETVVRTLSTSVEVETALRSQLGQYNKSNLRQQDFPLTSVAAACERAKKLDQTVGGGEVPTESTTRVYQLWEAIASKALPSQLPEELKCLRR